MPVSGGEEMPETKPLVLYYSRTGRTEKLARLIADDMDTEIMRVDPVRRYPQGYIPAFSRVVAERIEKRSTPCNMPVPDMTGFDPVFIGFPVWMGDMPQFFMNFIEKCDLYKKTVIPFSTSFSGGMGKALKSLERIAPDASVVLPFEDGSLKGGDYRKWRRDIRRLIRKLEDA